MGFVDTGCKQAAYLSTVIVFAMLSCVARAQTLDDVLQRVYETNPDIRAERARQDATAQGVSQARAGVLPQISGEASYMQSRNDQRINSTVFSSSDSSERRFELDPTAASVSVEQVLFAGFTNLHSINRAQALVSSGDAQLRAIEQDVLLRAAIAFFDVVRDTKIYNATASNNLILAEYLEQARARFRFGQVSKTDVNQAVARLASAQGELASAQNRLSASRAQYRRLVGEMPGTLDPNSPLPKIPETEESALALAAQLAPAIAQAQGQEMASRKQIQIEKSAFSPRVSLTAQYRYAEEPTSFVVQDEFFVYGVRATVPIFNGGLKFSKVREARALNRGDKSRIIAAERLVHASVSSAWSALVAARIRIAAAEQQETAAKAALQGVRQEAQFGVRTTLDVLNAEREFLNSKVALAAAQRDEYVAAYELNAAIGVIEVNGTDHIHNK